MELADPHADTSKMTRRFAALRAPLALALCTLAGGCASTGAVPRPFPTPVARATPPEAPPPASAPAPPARDADAPAPARGLDIALVETALALRGTPYRSGGSDPSGFDCSGFTQYVFALYGIPLPREVRDQFHSGTPVKTDELAAGDLLFFRTAAKGASHVGIAIGGDRFVHAPSTTGVVRVEHLGASYWSARYLGARRID
jgi:cell wall-associated NlpC family hydrolase